MGWSAGRLSTGAGVGARAKKRAFRCGDEHEAHGVHGRWAAVGDLPRAKP